MQILEFTVKDQVITMAGPNRIVVADSKKHVYAKFSFDAEWEGLAITATFTGTYQTRGIDVLLTSDEIEVPPEVLCAPGFRLSLIGVNKEGVQVPTAMMQQPVFVSQSGSVAGLPAGVRNPELWQQALGAIGDLSKLDTDNKETLVHAINETLRASQETDNGQAAPEDTPTSAEYFDIDHDGIVCLKIMYRGCADEEGKAHSPYSISDMGVGKEGSRLQELPEKIVIPDVINGTAVAGLAPGMFFMNYRVKEIVLPDGVDALPDLFCREALNLHTLRNTERIRKMGKTVAAYTRVEKLLFPNLQEVVSQSFAACGYLRVVDIGNHVTEIPSQMFYQSVKLSRVMGGGSVTKIGSKAFYLTMDLKNLPLLSNVTNIGDDAFYRSRIQFDWSSLAGKCTFGTRATPVIDNTVDFWSGVNYTPCENRIVSMLSQKDPRWENEYFGSSATLNKDGCAIFCILHIHSAITGNMYATVKEFEDELQQTAPALLLEENHPKYDSKRVAFIEALGYKAEMHTGTLDTAAYQSICDALARGAYVYISIGAGTNVNDGHGVVLYGMNDIGEVMVLDSNYMMHTMHGSAVEREFMTYCLPLQNVTGTTNEFVVVEKKEE